MTARPLRVALLNQEPLALRGPLSVLFRGKGAPLPLRQALEPVYEAIRKGEITGVDLDLLMIDVEASYDKARDVLHLARVNGKTENRSEHELAATALYTCKNYFGLLNTALRNPNREAVRIHVEYLHLFVTAIRKFEKFTGRTVFRGMKGLFI